MSELDAGSFLIVAEQMPGKVIFKNYAELKEYLRKGLSVYENTQYSADNLEEAINDRNQLRAIRKKLTDKKKELEKAYTMPYEEVKHMLDDLIDMVKEPLDRADSIVKQCERQKKRNDIIAFAKRELDVLGQDAVNVLKSPAFYNQKWLNISYNMRDIQKEISKKVKKIQEDLYFIRTNGGENTPVLLARYFETLSIDGMDSFLHMVQAETEKTISQATVVAAEEAKTVSQATVVTGDAAKSISQANAVTGEEAKSISQAIVVIDEEAKKILPQLESGQAPNLQPHSNRVFCKTVRLWGTEAQLKSAMLQIECLGIGVEEL